MVMSHGNLVAEASVLMVTAKSAVWLPGNHVHVNVSHRMNKKYWRIHKNLLKSDRKIKLYHKE
jgi:hypothetical protein